MLICRIMGLGLLGSRIDSSDLVTEPWYLRERLGRGNTTFLCQKWLQCIPEEQSFRSMYYLYTFPILPLDSL